MRARYEVRPTEDPNSPWGNSWVEAREAEPPCRFRLRASATGVEVSEIIIDDEGIPDYDHTIVEIDIYVQNDEGEWVPDPDKEH